MILSRTVFKFTVVIVFVCWYRGKKLNNAKKRKILLLILRTATVETTGRNIIIQIVKNV